MGDVAAQPIDGIGRVDNHPTISEALHYLLYFPLIGILWIYFDEFRHFFQDIKLYANCHSPQQRTKLQQIIKTIP